MHARMDHTDPVRRFLGLSSRYLLEARIHADHRGRVHIEWPATVQKGIRPVHRSLYMTQSPMKL